MLIRTKHNVQALQNVNSPQRNIKEEMQVNTFSWNATSGTLFK